MARIKLSKSELENQLNEQLHFLITSSKLYDNGTHAEAKRIATILRIFFHDTMKSKSLLGQLKLKNKQWLNSAAPFNKESVVSHVGLTKIQFHPGRIPCLIPKGYTESMKYIDFNKWWSQPVISTDDSDRKIRFSRQNLILNVANTDGGAHVDSTIDELFVLISRKNGVGFSALVGEEKYPMLYPELPSLRQIAHEVLMTFKHNIINYFTCTYDDEIIFVPFSKKIEIDENIKVGFELKVRKSNA